MIHVNVARSPEEAELQAQGVDVMAEMFEKDESPASPRIMIPMPSPARSLRTNPQRPRPKLRPRKKPRAKPSLPANEKEAACSFEPAAFFFA